MIGLNIFIQARFLLPWKQVYHSLPFYKHYVCKVKFKKNPRLYRTYHKDKEYRCSPRATSFSYSGWRFSQSFSVCLFSFSERKRPHPIACLFSLGRVNAIYSIVQNQKKAGKEHFFRPSFFLASFHQTSFLPSNYFEWFETSQTILKSFSKQSCFLFS